MKLIKYNILFTIVNKKKFLEETISDFMNRMYKTYDF